jgi:hypothetical protein
MKALKMPYMGTRDMGAAVFKINIKLIGIERYL